MSAAQPVVPALHVVPSPEQPPEQPRGGAEAREPTDGRSDPDLGGYEPLAPPAGLLRVVAGPDEVEVLLGGMSLGPAPLEVFVSPGVYRVVVRRRGFAKYDGLVRIDDGMVTPLEVFLQPLSGVPRAPAPVAPPQRSGVGYGTIAVIGFVAAAAGFAAYRYSKTPDAPREGDADDEDDDQLPAPRPPAGEIEAPKPEPKPEERKAAADARPTPPKDEGKPPQEPQGRRGAAKR